MTRHKQPRDSGPNASQRQLQFCAAFALALLQVAPAMAEVCDKAIGISWQPKDGPVWLFNPSGFPFGLSVLLIGLLLIVFIKRSWLGYLAAALLLFYGATIIGFDLIPQHDVYRAEVQEGCRSYQTDLMDLAILAAFAIAYAGLGFRARSSNAKAL